MNLRVAGRDQIRMDIRAAQDEDRHFGVTFDQLGFGPGRPQSFKRVNALDQFVENAKGERIGVEKLGRVVPTRTRVLAGGWERVDLLGSDFKPFRALVGDAAEPFVGKDLFDFFTTVFQLSQQTEAGGEMLNIEPPLVAAELAQGGVS